MKRVEGLLFCGEHVIVEISCVCEKRVGLPWDCCERGLGLVHRYEQTLDSQ
jgi:hypothetical protein